MFSFGVTALGLSVLLLSLITVFGVVSVLRPAERLEKIAQERVWFAWRLAAAECIITPIFAPFVFYAAILSGTPLASLLLLLSPLVFIIRILDVGKHSIYGLKAAKIVLARVASALIAIGVLVITEDLTIATVLIGFTFILTWALLWYQMRVVKRELKKVAGKAAVQIDDVHDWAEERFVKQLKEEEKNNQ